MKFVSAFAVFAFLLASTAQADTLVPTRWTCRFGAGEASVEVGIAKDNPVAYIVLGEEGHRSLIVKNGVFALYKGQFHAYETADHSFFLQVDIHSTPSSGRVNLRADNGALLARDGMVCVFDSTIVLKPGI